MASVSGLSPTITTDMTLKMKTTPTPVVQARRPTRSGRLGVDKQGEYTYKNTPSSTLVASLQLGLQVSIGSIEPKPRRDILMTDFEVVETVEFPADGSTITPAHKHRDFTFKTYSPVAFRFFREAFGIVAEDYLLAMCAHPLREISNPGASGSLFYLSADDAFIIKTVQKKEAHFLQKLLPGYYLNLTQNKKTLLPKFFGLYRYKCGRVNIRIVVMNNLLPSTLKYHEKYDLKGSTYKRKATEAELGKSSPTFKDLDFQDRHAEGGGGMCLLPDKYEILMRTLDRDCRVLESFGIMDYSLLLGVHNIDQHKRDGELSSCTNSPGGGGEGREEERHSLVPSRIGLSKYSIISMENIPLVVDGEEANDSTSHYPERDGTNELDFSEGYIQGKVKGDTVLVFLGIIDILQSYRLKKKVEHTFKSMITDGNTVSVHNPSYYARRFYDFLEKRVFQREKVSRRPRKASKFPAGVRRSPGCVVRTQSMPHGRDRHYSSHSQGSHRRTSSGQSSNSPPLFSPPPSEGATPGKSNLKQGSQKKSTSSDASALLPEIPTIEVLSASDTEEGGMGRGCGRTPAKGVRFADQVGADDKEKEPKIPPVTSSSTSEASPDVKKRVIQTVEEREEIEMDSVDFDKVTGTSTPITEDSPSLPKHINASGAGSSNTTAEEGDEEVFIGTVENGKVVPAIDEKDVHKSHSSEAIIDTSEPIVEHIAGLASTGVDCQPSDTATVQPTDKS